MDPLMLARKLKKAEKEASNASGPTHMQMEQLVVVMTAIHDELHSISRKLQKRPAS